MLEDQLVGTGDISGDGLPRDGRGRYLLPHPVTGELTGRTRVTTMAAMGSSGYGLAIDRERKVVAGMGYRPDLGARAAAAHSAIETDPSAKKTLSQIAEAAYIQAGGNAGANYGTAQHAVFEQYFLHGVPLEKLAEYFHADIKAVERALEFHQLRLLPQYIERVVFSILFNRAGRIDGIAEHIPTGDLYIIDLKTEEDPIGHPKGKTIQLAYYGNADCMFNYQTNQWEPMPKVRTDVALIIHLRPGTGAEADLTKVILTVPIDQGWFGVRAVETMRAWNQQRVTVAPFISQANWTPAPVNTNGERLVSNGVVVPTVEQMAQEAIDGDMPLTPVVCHVCAADLTQMPHSTQCPMFVPLTKSDNAAQPTSGLAAQVGQIVDNAVASGQQLNAEQVAELNRQAAEVAKANKNNITGLPQAPAETPGQPVVGPGTPHIIKSGIHAQTEGNQPPKPEGVPDGRPPAPKSALGNMSAAEHLKELLEVPIGGVDPEAEVMDLATLPKPRLQELVCLASGNRFSMESPELKRHKKPLAEMLVPLLNEQRAMNGKPPVGSALLEHPEVQHTMQVAEVATNGFVDMSYEGVMKAITEAPNVDRITAIYNQIIETYGPNGWIPDFHSAAMAKHSQLANR
jgi:hypothetical protein